MNLAWPPRYGDEVLDYQIDWNPALGDDTITGPVTAEPSAGSSLDVENVSTSQGVTTVWLSGGGTTPRRDRIHLLATTTGGRKIAASVLVPIQAT